MRITILGLPASGKTTLASEISERLHIPYIHLDRFWLEAGGRHNSRITPNPERAQANVRNKARAAIRSESWVSDGVYRLVQPEIAERADVILFLDIPLWRRLLNHAGRIVHREQRHKEMSLWADVGFIAEIIRRDLRKKGNIENLIASHQNKTVVLKNRREIARYVASLGA